MRPGDRIADRFEIERPAGSGGMGTVYACTDLVTGYRVALKVMHRTAQEERFSREAGLLARLDHPGIVRYLAHGTTADGEPFLAMEWLDGEDLAARLRRGPLAIDEAVGLGIAVADTLAWAHARGVLHRDIKPENLLLAGGDPADPRILDLGIARLRGPRSLTATGTAIGSPGYMAPEQAQGQDDLDERADLFSLGCVLHEALSGAVVFPGDHVAAVIGKLIAWDPPPIQALVPRVSRALSDLLESMLAKDREKRPESALAVADALRAAGRGRRRGRGGPAPDEAGAALGQRGPRPDARADALFGGRAGAARPGRAHPLGRGDRRASQARGGAAPARRRSPLVGRRHADRRAPRRTHRARARGARGPGGAPRAGRAARRGGGGGLGARRRRRRISLRRGHRSRGAAPRSGGVRRGRGAPRSGDDRPPRRALRGGDRAGRRACPARRARDPGAGAHAARAEHALCGARARAGGAARALRRRIRRAEGERGARDCAGRARQIAPDLRGPPQRAEGPRRAADDLRARRSDQRRLALRHPGARSGPSSTSTRARRSRTAGGSSVPASTR